MDHHGSHASQEFIDSCANHLVLLLWMPPRPSEQLQKQKKDFGTSNPLKTAYRIQIDFLVRIRILYIKREDFIDAFCMGHSETITDKNLRAGFKGSDLYTCNTEEALSCLHLKISSPSTVICPPQEWLLTEGIL